MAQNHKRSNSRIDSSHVAAETNEISNHSAGRRRVLRLVGTGVLLGLGTNTAGAAPGEIDVKYGGCKGVQIIGVKNAGVVTIDVSYIDDNGDGHGPVSIPAILQPEDPARYPDSTDGPLTVRYLDNRDTTFIRIDGGRNTSIRQITLKDNTGDSLTRVQNPNSQCVQNTPPTAQFTFSPINPVPYEEVLFDASTSGDSDGEIILYEWDFTGDGSPEYVSNFPDDATYVYKNSGAKGVTLTVVDDLGGTGSITESVPVNFPQNGLRLWLNADEGIAESEGAVATWQDQSGNNYDFTTSDATERPTLVSNAVNGHAALRFDGDGDRLQNESTLGIPNDSGRTFFVVCKFDQAVIDTTKRSPVLMQGQSGSDRNHYGFEGNSYLQTDNKPYVYLVGSTYRTTAVLDTAFSVHTLRTETFPAWTDIVNTTTYYVNGVNKGPLTEIAFNHVNFNGDTTTLGSFAHRADSGYSSHDGDIAEVLIYEGALSDSDREEVEGYLARKYGI